MTLGNSLVRIGSRLRRSTAWAHALPSGVAALSIVALAAWAGYLVTGSTPLRSLVAWGAVAVGLVAMGVRWWQVRRGFDPRAIARRMEASGVWRQGALTGLLDPISAGTSPDLHAAAVARQVERMKSEGVAALSREQREVERRGRQLVIGAVVALVVLMAARPASGSPGALLAPWSLWKAFTSPIQLTTPTPVVDRGARATFDIVAYGQRSATLQVRGPGEPWRAERIELSSDGTARVTSEPLTSDLLARVDAGGHLSPELRISLRPVTFLGVLSLRADYPAYLHMESELLPVEGDTLILPEGTRLTLAATASAPLGRALLQSIADSVVLNVEDRSLRGGFVPRQNDSWQLSAMTSEGKLVEGLPPPIPVRLIVDSVPTVTIPVPGGDTIAPPSHRLPVVISIEDDHGIATGALEVQKNGGAVVRLPLDIDPGADRALLSSVLDLTQLGAKAGDTVRYAGTARDHAPGHGPGRSRSFIVVLPTVTEEREARVNATEEVSASLDSLVEESRKAARASEDLSRSRQRAEGSGTATGQAQPMSAEAARRAAEVARVAERVAERVEEMRRQVEELEHAAERATPSDSALAKDLRDIRELLDKAMTPELQSAMERLRESLRTLDPEATQESLRDLAAEQARMRAALERARELFERVALETSLASLADEAADIKAAQERLISELARDSATTASAQSSALANRAAELAKGLEDAAAQVPSMSTENALKETANSARRSADQMRRASEAAQQGNRERARQEAEAAGESMKDVPEEIRRQRKSLQEQMREDVMRDLRRLMAETSRVVSRQFAVSEAFRRGALVGPLRAEEAMLEEATAKLLQQVIAVAAKNALVSPTVSVALAGARDGLRGALEASSAATPSLGLAADRAGDAVDMLALAAYALVQSERKIEDSESGSGVAEAMEQMMQMAGQQNAAANKGQAMQQQGAQPGMGEMMQLALQQRAIAQQLERLRAQGTMPGAGELGQEARDVARALEAGQLTPELIERQRQLFRRMLDAGRSLDGDQDEQSSARKSEAAKDSPASRPGVIDPALLGRDAIRVPSWEELQRLPHDDRRRVLDYFRRLAEVRRP